MQEEQRAETEASVADERSVSVAPVGIWTPVLEAGSLRGEAAQTKGVWRLAAPAGMSAPEAAAAVLSEAIASGKQVLFLPQQEETAAAVKQCLREEELDPFCVCLGSDSAQTVLEKQKTLKKEIDQALPGLQKTCAEERAKQADWIRILYGKRNGGWPLWELAIRYETYRDAPGGMAFSLKEISGVSAKTVNDWNGLLLRLVSAAQAVGHPCGHVLSGIGQTQDSRQLRVYAPQSLVLYREALEQVKQRAAALCDSLQEPAPTTKEALLQLYTFSTILSEMKSLPASWMGMTDFTGFLRKLREMTVHGKRERALFSELSKDWLQDLLRQDGTMLLEDWEKSCGKWSVSRNMEQKRILKHLAPYARHPIGKETIGPAMEKLRSYQKENDAVAKLLSGCRGALSGLYQEQYTDWNAIERLCAIAESCDQKLRNTGCMALFQKSARVDWKAAQAFAGTWRTFSEMQAGVYRLFRITDQPAREGETYLEAQQRACEIWRTGLSMLSAWVQWQAVREEAIAAGLQTVVTAYEAGMAHEEIVPAYEKALFGALMEEAVSGEPAAGSLSEKPADVLAAELRKKDLACRALTRKEWRSRALCRASEIFRKASAGKQTEPTPDAESSEQANPVQGAQMPVCVLAQPGKLPDIRDVAQSRFSCVLAECDASETPKSSLSAWADTVLLL